MLSALVHRVRAAATEVIARIGVAVRAGTRPPSVVVGLLLDATRSREELVAENALLRQQLIVAARAVERPKFAARERGLLVLLARLVPRWREAVLLVKPETILRWSPLPMCEWRVRVGVGPRSRPSRSEDRARSFSDRLRQYRKGLRLRCGQNFSGAETAQLVIEAFGR